MMKSIFLYERLKIIFNKKLKTHLQLSFIVLIANIVLTTNAFAQSKSISGTVADDNDGEPLIGVSISIKGTTTGTVSDLNGDFQLQANTGDVLLFSFVGYVSKELTLKNETKLNIALSMDLMELDELVVIGYGVQNKKLVTGATAQVKGTELEKRNSTNTLQALQGQVAGVNITSASGQPGEGMKVSIRGVGTVGNATPLYIVDGVQTSDLNYLNTADIESVDVLKDAASAAIYGSRAANGVILITTKKGSSGKGQVTFDSYFGVQNIPKEINLLNNEQYATIMNEQAANSGISESRWPFDLDNLPAYTNEGVANTDWLDEMFVENALTKNIVIGASGGTENSIYSMSISYTGQEGIVGGKSLSNYERYSGRLNSEHKLFNGHVKFGENFTLSYIQKNGVDVGGQYSNPLRSAYNTSPLLPVYDNNGIFTNSGDSLLVDQDGIGYWNPEEINSYANMVYNNQNTTNIQKVIGNIYAEFTIIKNLKFRTSLGIDYHNLERRGYVPVYQLSALSENLHSKANQRMEKGLGLTFDNLLSYTLNLKSHKIEAMAGMSVQQYNGSFLYVENTNLAFNDLEHAYIDNTTNQDWANLTIQGAPYDEDKLSSYFGRVQYGFKETYLLNATFRADGSSKFAEENRWGYFPSFSAGWVMSNEEFMSSSLAFLNFLKFRASWGQNGNQNIQSFQYLAPITFTDADYSYGETEGVNTTGSYPSRLPNENLKWETSEQLNIGFDARLFKRRLGVYFDYYNKTTKDWLLVAPILATAGADAPYINGGNVSNKGVELAVSYTHHVGDFSFSINANGAYNKNNVTDIPTADGIVHGASNILMENSQEFYRAEAGHPIGFFWGYETDGIFQNQDEIDNYVDTAGKRIQGTADPGDLKMVDQNGDGKINDEDKVELGDPNPDFLYGLSFNCEYKAFDFQIVTNGVIGNQIVQSYRGRGQYNNYTTKILDRWTGEGTSNTIPRVTNEGENYRDLTSLYIENGDYFRISNITLGFDMAKLVSIKHISQLRLYFSAQNLYTFTKYTGMDPEVGYGHDGGDTDSFSSGIDVGYYPRPKTYLFGVNVKF